MNGLTYLPQGRIIKADDAGPGESTGYASTWDNVDAQDEVVVRGAFVRSLARWRAEGRRIPVVTDHDHTVSAVIGSLMEAREDAYALFVRGCSRPHRRHSPPGRRSERVTSAG